MIFQFTWERILLGRKNQTRRRVVHEGADGEWGPSGILVDAGMCNGFKIDEGELKRIEVIYHDGGRLQWAVGKTYAVQPGRGKRATFWKRENGQIIATADPQYSETYQHWTRKALIANGFREMRIQIIAIRREDVRNISFEDARAEGFIDRSDFMLTWCNMHDKQLNLLWYDCFQWEQDGEWREGIEEFYDYLRTRPAAFYDAWVLEFKLVED